MQKGKRKKLGRIADFCCFMKAYMKVQWNYHDPGASDQQIEDKIAQFCEFQARNDSDLFVFDFPRDYFLQLYIGEHCYAINNQITISLMNPLPIPYFFLYCAGQQYAYFQQFACPLLLPENQVDLPGQFDSEDKLDSKNNVVKLIKQSEESVPRKLGSREIIKRKQKKLQSIKKQQKDVEFKQRQQTTNRNLCSNTLKIFFKQLRDKNSETFLNINKIIAANQIGMSRQSFLQKVDQIFPPASTYVSFETVRKICKQVPQDFLFAQVLRTSFRRFFAYEIFAVNIKSIRTTRKIRNQQIKQGKQFLRELSL